MSPFDDDRDVTSSRDLDDRAADGLLRGRAVPGEPELSAFVDELLALADGPAPAPSAALAAMLEGGLAADTRVLPVAVPVGTKAVSWRVRGRALPL
ncbi:MAG: hypothetical protein JWN55_2110, partial [Frankiales bacterium]|nr:hypothetical protein [Frankiales bacterium]